MIKLTQNQHEKTPQLKRIVRGICLERKAMKKVLLLLLMLLVVPSVANAAPGYSFIINDSQLRKDPTYWRAKARMVPSLGVGLGFGFRPVYYAPSNAEVQPYITSGLSISIGAVAAQFGARGYWSDLRMGVSWGFSKALTDNVGSSQYARLEYPRDVGLSLGKSLFVEKNTGIRVGFGVSGRIPVSPSSQLRTLITSLSPRLSASKTFLGRISLSYGFGVNFNFYLQDSGVYNPDLAGIPGVNNRWGMNHSFGLGVAILPNLRVSFGLSIGVGYSFADNYTAVDGPQVFGAENLTPADLASFPINEGNSYGIGFTLSYAINRHIGLSLGYSNGGRQFEWQFDSQGNRHFVLRNPFKLENGSFNFGIRGSI